MNSYENIRRVVEDLSEKGFDFNTATSIYNPLEKFIEYVGPKEIVHSKIISDLLNPEGQHGLNDVFIRQFLLKFLGINYDTVSDIKVSVEKHIERTLTAGGLRSIDIFIEFTVENTCKTAIIIENKLNNAAYQYLQLEDYYHTINSSGNYQNIHLLCFHKYKTVDDRILTLENINIRPKVIYPLELSKWIDESIGELYSNNALSIRAYSIYLKNLACHNRILSNIKLLMKLPEKLFSEVKAIAQAYNQMMNDRLPVVAEALRTSLKWNELEVKYHSRTENIEIWNPSDYKRNSLFIVLWKRMEGFTLYLASDSSGENSNGYITDAGFEKIGDRDYEYVWYVSKDKSLQNYSYPDQSELERMVDEINRLLNVLHKDTDS